VPSPRGPRQPGQFSAVATDAIKTNTADAEKSDLEFIGFEWPDTDTPARYRARFPDDPAQSDLDRWHRFETDRPDTFVLMYQFWVRKRTGSLAATGANTTSSKLPPSAR